MSDPFTDAKRANDAESRVGGKGFRRAIMNAAEQTIGSRKVAVATPSVRLAQAVVAALLVAPLAHAQESSGQPESSGQLEELIVTAPKYVSSGSLSAMKSDTPLVEIPQSVTVISRDQIDLLKWS